MSRLKYNQQLKDPKTMTSTKQLTTQCDTDSFPVQPVFFHHAGTVCIDRIYYLVAFTWTGLEDCRQWCSAHYQFGYFSRCDL